MRLDLLLKELKDQATRENFERVQDLFATLRLLDGDWKFFDVDCPNPGIQEIKHKLSFAPKDIILVSALGSQGFFFDYNAFDREHLYIQTTGPVRIRFFAGVIKEGAYGQSDANSRAVAQSYPPHAPGLSSQVVLDFGSTPVADKLFEITSAGMVEGMYLTAQIASAVDQDEDEAELTPMQLICQAKNGSYTIRALTLEGRASGKFVASVRIV